RWMAAVLACGAGAALSHGSAAALWGFRPDGRGPVEVSIPNTRRARHKGIRVHRRGPWLEDHVTHHVHIRLTEPLTTLVDLTPRLSRHRLERAIDEADRLDLASP